MPDLPRTIVYVGGFNFYYAAFRGKRPRARRLKWLDIAKFSRLLLPEHEVCLVGYFTAAVKPLEWDPVRIRCRDETTLARGPSPWLGPLTAMPARAACASHVHRRRADAHGRRRVAHPRRPKGASANGSMESVSPDRDAAGA